MKKIFLSLVCILFLATTSMAGTKYVDGSTTGLYYNKELDMWMTRIVQVYTIHARSLVDDLSYITVGDGASMTKAFLLERGLPGEPNADTRFERERFIKELEEGLKLMDKAREEGKDFTRHLARFYSLELELKSEDKGRDVKVGVLLHDYDKKTDLMIYLNEREVNELISLLEKVPPVLKELRESTPRSPLLP